jgi:large subunit ribosomal protein L37Ae
MLRTARYGLKIRRNYNEIKKAITALYECPRCEKKKLKRKSFAIFVCKSCKATVAGGAYKPYTEAGETIKRIINELNSNN